MKHIIYPILLVLGVWCLTAFIKSTYQFSPEEVRPQIERVVGTSNYRIIDQSNNSVWVGTPGEVTYNIELLDDNSVVSCKCTDGIFQPRICRKYE